MTSRTVLPRGTPYFIHWITGNGFFSVVAFWMIAAGVIGALLAAIFGLIDWIAVPLGNE